MDNFLFEHENVKWNMVECEAERIYAYPVIGEGEAMVQEDMKSWAIKKGLWETEPYNDMIVLHAIDRGWLQENFTGMEVL